ncbi:hypothetical protein [Rhizohabitans arisaemae]|uniref:hypothetical protein n=1 Tax=Rhizohabitans arisaemae TaxID=2720610 RepID=UPI0024B0EE52|nr:hypothetical protein [Rhizohabitans arisaemae]
MRALGYFAAILCAGLVGGCGGEAPSPAADRAADTPAPSGVASATPIPGGRPYTAQDLRGALLGEVPGLRRAYGPEAGLYGALRATRLGNEAMAKAELNKPQCRKIGQIDPTSVHVRNSPAAVIVFGKEGFSLTEALIALAPEEAVKPFEVKAPRECSAYRARVGKANFSYLTREMALEKLGDGFQGYLTRATGEGYDLQIGTATVRHRNVIVSLLVVGKEVGEKTVRKYAEEAYHKVSRTLR